MITVWRRIVNPFLLVLTRNKAVRLCRNEFSAFS